MSGDYIGKTDAGILSWLKVFAQHMSSQPSVYQISAAEAAGIQAAVDAYDAAYQDSRDDGQRTPAIVAVKDEARNAAVQLCRQYAQIIRLNAGIDNEDKIAAGIRPINPNREPRHCPQASPAVILIAATMGAHTLKVVDSLNTAARARPFGATEAQVFIGVADEAITDPNGAKFYGKFTRNPIVVAFQNADNGKQATYFARWAGIRGDVSMWSNPLSMAIAA